MKHLYIFTVFCLTFFIVGIVTLSGYGMNWDAPIRMLRGQAYAHIFLTGGQTYGYPDRVSPILIKPNEHATRLNFVAGEYGNYVQLPNRVLPKLEFRSAQESSGKKFSFYQHEAWNGSQFKNDDTAHLPLIDILSAFSNRFFFGVLGVLGDIESYQLVNLFISSIGILLVCIFTFEITSSAFASIVAGLSLALFPIFFAEAHFNSKDPVQATFFTGALWAFMSWIRSGNSGGSGLRWFGVFGVFVAFALGVKWNIIFLPLILLPWLFLIRKTEEFKAWFKLGRLWKLGILGGLGIFLFLVAIWPYAWSDPFGRMLSIFSYYKDVGFVGENNLQPDKFILPLGFNAYPLLLFLTQTPEIVLILGILGVVWVVRERGGDLKIGYLLLLWLSVPLIRQSLPNMWFFNGLRQIMEVLPAMAIFSGLGFYYLVQRFNLKPAIQVISLIAFFIVLIVPIIRLHPNQNAYFNIFAGGFKGTVEKNLVDWWFNYGNVYKQAALWLNSNAEKDANIALIDGSMFALSPLFLRDDISISPNHFSGLDKKGEYILQPFNPFNPPVFAYRYPALFLNPLHVVSIDKVPVVTVYKNDWQFTKAGFINEGSITDFKISRGQSEGGDYIEVDLGQDLQVTRLVVEDTPARCKLLNFQAIDEFVKFVPEGKIDQVESVESFGLLEKKNREKGQIEFWFPAQNGRFIQIYPRAFSCFIQGKISEVYYLEQ